jgi:hypothetical protein
VFRDLQDTLDRSKNFYYGSCKLAKHPLGIANIFESFGMKCTIFQHRDEMKKPIVSRHGQKGGRFLDGMYTTKQGLPYILGITIIQDMGIHSDHDMIINKFDLGIKLFEISKEKEEKIECWQIMNIPVTLKPGQEHPSLNDYV